MKTAVCPRCRKEQDILLFPFSRNNPKKRTKSCATCKAKEIAYYRRVTGAPAVLLSSKSTRSVQTWRQKKIVSYGLDVAECLEALDKNSPGWDIDPADRYR